jgi:hypothetical protein
MDNGIGCTDIEKIKYFRDYNLNTDHKFKNVSIIFYLLHVHVVNFNIIYIILHFTHFLISFLLITLKKKLNYNVAKNCFK